MKNKSLLQTVLITAICAGAVTFATAQNENEEAVKAKATGIVKLADAEPNSPTGKPAPEKQAVSEETGKVVLTQKPEAPSQGTPQTNTPPKETKATGNVVLTQKAEAPEAKPETKPTTPKEAKATGNVTLSPETPASPKSEDPKKSESSKATGIITLPSSGNTKAAPKPKGEPQAQGNISLSGKPDAEPVHPHRSLVILVDEIPGENTVEKIEEVLKRKVTVVTPPTEAIEYLQGKRPEETKETP